MFGRDPAYSPEAKGNVAIMLIDTHAHLDFEDFDKDRDEVIKRSFDQGLAAIINVGSSVEGTERSVQLAGQNEFIYASIGIHPHDADKTDDKDLNLVRSFVGHKKVVAVGEIGLDYYRNISSKEKQRDLFIALLMEAKKKNLPVIIHNRDANDDTMSILNDIMDKPVKAVMHCFSGNREFLDSCLGLGLFVSFTGSITFKNASLLRDVVKAVPIERLMVETDCPFLSPQIFRGRRNEPLYVKYVAEEIARIKGLSIEEVEDVTTNTARSFFNL